MKTTVVLGTAVAFSAIALTAHTARAQAPCATTPSLIDSARVEATSILFADRPLLTELRRDQRIPPSANQVAVSVIRDASVCQRLAAQFDHTLAPGTSLAVVRVGPVFYARDPDQRHATGIFADSTLHVLLRVGAAIDK
jgi:hypothetical protein